MEGPETSLGAVDTRSLTERVYDQLRRSLLQGKLIAGDSMTIRGTAQALGTSEMPVREAMKRLLAERMIIQKPNRTFQVPPLERTEFEELTSIRISLEGWAARQALARADDALIGQLTRHNSTMKTSLDADDSAAVLAANQEFHFALYQAANSDILMQLIKLLWMRSGPYLAEALTAIEGSKAFFVTATETHDKLITALMNKDEDGVFDALRDDLGSTARWYKANLTSQSENENTGTIFSLPMVGLNGNDHL